MFAMGFEIRYRHRRGRTPVITVCCTRFLIHALLRIMVRLFLGLLNAHLVRNSIIGGFPKMHEIICWQLINALCKTSIKGWIA